MTTQQAVNEFDLDLPDWAGPFTQDELYRMEMEAEWGAREDDVRERYAAEIRDLEREAEGAHWMEQQEWLASLTPAQQHEELWWSMQLSREEARNA